MMAIEVKIRQKNSQHAEIDKILDFQYQV